MSSSNEIWGDGLRMGHVVCMSRQKERTVGAIKKSTFDPHDLTRVDSPQHSMELLYFYVRYL